MNLENKKIFVQRRKTEMFGPHLTLDIYGCNKTKLSNLDLIYRLLDTLPEKIGMHKISPPQVTWYDGNDSGFDKGGVSGFVLIAESHISIHTFTAQQYVSVDIFSCKEFDHELATKKIMDFFGAKKAEKNFFMRGREFPKEIPKAAKIVALDRGKISDKRACVLLMQATKKNSEKK